MSFLGIETSADKSKKKEKQFSAAIGDYIKRWMENPFDVQDPLEGMDAGSRTKAIRGGISQRGDYQAALEFRNKQFDKFRDDLNASRAALRTNTKAPTFEQQQRQEEFLNAYRSSIQSQEPTAKVATGQDERDYLGL